MARKTRKASQKKRSATNKSATKQSNDLSDIPLHAATIDGQPKILNARPDGLDFRDRMYVPTLVEVPTRRELSEYREVGAPVLDQGSEGACTGFGLAAVANYLLRKRRIVPDDTPVSPYMLYDLARRYDEWPGEGYEGSSCRGAIKGWYKHGVCESDLWRPGSRKKTLTEQVVSDAAMRPLGAYFRVNHKDLVAMHAAISEAGILYASAIVHSGWEKVRRNGRIRFEDRQLGGHAFAIVAYDSDGFWIQNSWGGDWGHEGFCHLGYDDWLANGTDVWVARLGVPVMMSESSRATSRGTVTGIRSEGIPYHELRPHVISIKNDGQLDDKGDIGTTPESVREILRNDFPRITAGWKKKRLVLYAHGGLVKQDDALSKVAAVRAAALAAECYPLAFIWKTDYWSTVKNMLKDATQRRRPEGIIDDTKDFMLDRLDDALEPLARVLTGKASWDEMKENALLATSTAAGGARIVADEIARLAAADPDIEIHVIGHSAGSIFHAPLVEYLTGKGAKGLGLKIKTCTLWAPACTTRLFKNHYLPAIKSGVIEDAALFTLTDKAERDDHCANIYHKSLLYLVSNAFEETTRIPIFRPDGEAILGMQKFVDKDAELSELIRSKKLELVLSPNTRPIGSADAARAHTHGGFDDDEATVKATLARVIGKTTGQSDITFKSGASARREVRRKIDGVQDAALTR